MKRLYTLALLLSFAVVASVLLLTNDNNDTVLRMRKHNWSFNNPFGGSSSTPATPAAPGTQDYYDPSNTDCITKCSAAQGISCGLAQLNCCDPAQCNFSFHGRVCDKRVVVNGCTKAKPQ